MPGKQIQIGPFKGGLNTHSDNSAIDDSELVVCDNFELDFDGSLVSRPPLGDLNVPMPLQGGGNIHLLGYYTAPGNVSYLIGTDGDSRTYYFNGSVWTLITSTFAAADMTQFNGKAWLVAPVGSTVPGGYWSPTTNFVQDLNMPKGDTIAAYKSRLWIAQGKAAVANNTYVYFSGLIGDTPFWPVAANFIDVGSGDGQNVIKLVAYFNNLIIFRDNSIYTLTYGTDPATAVFSILVPGIGLTDKNCVAVYQAYLYFMHNEKVYEFFNNRATQINQRVPFTSDSQAGIYLPFAVSLFNQRVMVTFWDKLYVFSLLTRTWTTWSSSVYGSLGKFVTAPASDGPEQAIVHSSDSVTQQTLRNLNINPDFATTSGYNYRVAGSGGTGVMSLRLGATPVPGVVLSQNLRLVVTSSGAPYAELFSVGSNMNRVDPSQGKYTASVWVRPSKVLQFYTVVSWFDINGVQISFDLVPFSAAAAVFTRAVATLQPPANAVRAGHVIRVINPTQGMSIDLAGMQFQLGTLTDFISGRLADDSIHDYTWEGAVNGSVSKLVLAPTSKTLQILDTVGSVAEEMTCTFRTKNYNYQASSVMKRLFWGGIDAIFRGRMTARAIPIFFAKQLTWGQVAALTWGQVSKKTWGNLSTDNATIEKIIDSPGSSAQRKFQKLFKSLFFRQIAFECIFETDGSTQSAPVQVFSVMTYVLAKADVSEATS